MALTALRLPRIRGLRTPDRLGRTALHLLELTRRQRELLQELDSLTAVENKPEQRSTLLGKMKDIFS